MKKSISNKMNLPQRWSSETIATNSTFRHLNLNNKVNSLGIKLFIINKGSRISKKTRVKSGIVLSNKLNICWLTIIFMFISNLSNSNYGRDKIHIYWIKISFNLIITFSTLKSITKMVSTSHNSLLVKDNYLTLIHKKNSALYSINGLFRILWCRIINNVNLLKIFSIDPSWWHQEALVNSIQLITL